MKHPLWSAIYPFFQDIDTFVGSGTMPGAEVKQRASAVKKQAGPAPGAPLEAGGVLKAFVPTDELLDARQAIRSKLDVLKASLAASLTERETYLVLFPVVVYCDEVIQNKFFTGQEVEWPPLQKELFRIDNGGEAFYDTLDDLLRKPETLPFVYEVFTYCLNAGFRGKYGDNLAKISKYKTELVSRIPIPTVEKPPEQAAGASLIAASRFPVWYYLAAAAFVAAAFVAYLLLAATACRARSEAEGRDRERADGGHLRPGPPPRALDAG